MEHNYFNDSKSFCIPHSTVLTGNLFALCLCGSQRFSDLRPLPFAICQLPSPVRGLRPVVCGLWSVVSSLCRAPVVQNSCLSFAYFVWFAVKIRLNPAIQIHTPWKNRSPFPLP
jgi:hypothetical protein